MKRAHPPAVPGAVRIIGGNLRGSKLAVPALAGLRPTPQRLRETLFNWLMPVLEGARALDLFAGSGALGIEAISRGAAHALLIERDRAQAEKISVDLQRLHLENAEVRCADALEFLANSPAQPFGIVFLDPPFESDLWGGAAALLDGNGWLTPDTYVYIESPWDAAPALPGHWKLHRESRAGAVRGALYRPGQFLPQSSKMAAFPVPDAHNAPHGEQQRQTVERPDRGVSGHVRSDHARAQRFDRPRGAAF